MKSHDRLRIVFAQIRQNWRAFAHVMHVHENHCIKRAGVAGIRARATAFRIMLFKNIDCYANLRLIPKWKQLFS
ncbi:hypothetical protein CC067_15565 [Salmonella enterica]|nr:hypothetical protein [Salmonella enterica]ECF4634053.1 hypothetical protein [Salmonella enterica subsp. enterica serovar Mbandaka]EEV6947251.1 hypothetical protein [Escherichia coli]EAO2183459.1 hypothetical protein [Salmonella enterica]EAQ4973055.1 hypothetical protein [Salmonella enterica]